MYPDFEAYIHSFVSLSRDEWEQVAACFRPMVVPKHTIVLQSGEVANSIYFVRSGGVRTFYTQGGKDITRIFFFQGRFACALTSFLTRQPSSETMETLEDTELLCASHDGIQRLYEQVPSWQELGRKVMEGAYLISTDRIESLTCLDATQRYLKMVAAHPDIFQRVPQYQIASYLGVEPETVSRIRRKLARRTIS